MSSRHSICLAVIFATAGASLAGQGAPPRTPSKASVMPRTPDGHPDLEGAISRLSAETGADRLGLPMIALGWATVDTERAAAELAEYGPFESAADEAILQTVAWESEQISSVAFDRPLDYAEEDAMLSG